MDSQDMQLEMYKALVSLLRDKMNIVSQFS